MTRVIGSELFKLRTTRTFYGVTLSAVALVVVITVIAAATATFHAGDVPGRDLLGIAGLAQLFTLVLGILGVTAEFRHGTITPSLLVVPDRTRLVLAKLAAHLLAGLLIGALAYVLCAALGLGILSARNIDTGLDSSDLIRMLIGGSVAAALFAAVGVGLGAVVRNQVGAVVGALAYLFVIEPLVGIIPGIKDTVGTYGFGGVSDGLALRNGSSDSTDLLGQLPAGLLFAGYAALFVVAGIILMRRRDITS